MIAADASFSFEVFLEVIRGIAVDHGRAQMPSPIHREMVDEGLWALTVSSPGALQTGFGLPCTLDERFTGLGEQFIQVDKRGRVFEGLIGRSVNSPVRLAHALDGGYKMAPLYYSSAGYAAWLDGTRESRIELAVSDPNEVLAFSHHDTARLYVAEGSPYEAVSRVTERTGRPPLAPPWAYGVWKATRGGHEAVLEQARRMRDEGLGASAVWIDWHYEPETNSGAPIHVMFDVESYPDIASTVAGVHDLGFKALTYVAPWLYERWPTYAHALEHGYAVTDANGHALSPIELATAGTDNLLDSPVAFIDFTNPEARAWYQGLLRGIMLDEGFDGWMSDFGEAVHTAAVLADGTRSDVAHNRYPILYHEATAQALSAKPDTLFFARGGFLGAQAHVPVWWPGDQTLDWSRESGIGSVPAAGITAGLMGAAAWGPDIAGIMGFPALEAGYGRAVDDVELWIRWCQLGAMSPVMREHLGFRVRDDDPPPTFQHVSGANVWTNDETIDTWRRCAAWHLGIFPHLYSLAHEATATGRPILRGMMLHYPDDPYAWTCPNQWLLGDSLMCAPVLDKGVRTRRTYLPEGSWTDIWTGEQLDGPGWVDVDAPLTRWPVLQRSGTIVPHLASTPLDLNDSRYANGDFDLEVRLTPGFAATYRLFDGTELRTDGSTFVADGPRTRRYVILSPDGHPLAEPQEGTHVEAEMHAS